MPGLIFVIEETALCEQSKYINIVKPAYILLCKLTHTITENTLK